MAETTREERLAAMQVVGELIQWLAGSRDTDAPQLGNTGTVIARAFSDADRVEEMEAKNALLLAQEEEDTALISDLREKEADYERLRSECESAKAARDWESGRADELAVQVAELEAENARLLKEAREIVKDLRGPYSSPSLAPGAICARLMIEQHLLGIDHGIESEREE